MLHIPSPQKSAGVAQLARATACHAVGREFESLRPLQEKRRTHGENRGFFVLYLCPAAVIPRSVHPFVHPFQSPLVGIKPLVGVLMSLS